ncbi:MAG: hypothetical protein HUJ53_03615 [Holdemanella sp.]|nr:hypothetical protein [Holdemanella sp.]
MANKKKPKRRIRLSILLIPVLVIVLIVGVLFLFNGKSTSKDGKAYIKKQEALKVSEITKTLKQKRKDDRKAAIDAGMISVFDLLEDYVFYGDSRVVGYDVYNYLEPGRVFAAAGHTYLNVEEWDQQLKDYNPSTIIISYGVNDMGLGLDDIEGGYDGLAKEKIQHILSIVPDAKIYVCTIIPCTQVALERSPNWGNYNRFNEKLKIACDAFEQCTLVETASLGNGGNAPIYAEDGIHFLSSFYPTWLQRIVDAMD